MKERTENKIKTSKTLKKVYIIFAIIVLITMVVDKVQERYSDHKTKELYYTTQLGNTILTCTLVIMICIEQKYQDLIEIYLTIKTR